MGLLSFVRTLKGLDEELDGFHEALYEHIERSAISVEDFGDRLLALEAKVFPPKKKGATAPKKKK